ncbi:BglG family transcription antiterminator [Enterococcus alishanensis]
MDVLAVQLLEMILSNRNNSLTSLERKFSLTKGKLDYRIRKINQELQLNQLGSIKKVGIFLTFDGEEKKIRTYLKSVVAELHFSDEQRLIVLYLAVLFHHHETLQSLAERLKISKNTVIKDKKKLQTDYLDELQIELSFSRKTGFFLKGKESDIRRLGIKFIRKFEDSATKLKVILQVIKMDPQIFEALKQKIEVLEEDLDLEFTEFKRTDLYLTIAMCIYRFKQGNTLENGLLDGYIRMVEPDFYQKIGTALSPFLTGQDSINEIHFISIQLLSTNLIKIRSNYQDPQLEQEIIRFINSFEVLGITNIKDKCQLEQALYQHLIPAYYRIRFGLPDNEVLSVKAVDDYEYIHPLVKRSISGIEKYLKITFPEGELIYLSIILLSFVSEELEKQTKRTIDAIVVCQHGISVSKLLFGELKLLFNNIRFAKNVSLREFYKEDLSQVDVVFSTVPLKTNKEVFLINHFLSNEEKINLKNEVTNRINFQPNTSNHNHQMVTQLVNIIQQNSEVTDLQRLVDDLQNYILTNNVTLEVNKSQNDPELVELLPVSHIQIYPKVDSLAEAIRIAGKPLVNQGYIHKDYLETIIENYDPEFPYFVIAPGVAIPHAGPEDGVYKVGMSLLKLHQPIHFSENLTVDVIVIVAPKDKKSHMKAVTKLYEIAKEADFLANIRQLTYEKEIQQYIAKKG